MLPVKTFIVEDSPIILDNLVATLEELAPVQVVGSAPDEDAALNWLTADGQEVDLELAVRCRLPHSAACPASVSC